MDESANHLPFQHEICFIDSNIQDMRDVALHAHLQTLNLHCNSISKIDNLYKVPNLRHLDLSSNCIVYMTGLDGLASLRTVNLSCNLIQTVDSLQDLQSLVQLDLSYNNVHDLSGLKAMSGPGYQLKRLQLHGNDLKSVEHIIDCLSGLSCLEELTLDLDGSSNPVCNMPGYRSAILNSIPHLRVLDGVNRLGQAVLVERDVTDIPGLEGYLEYLFSSDVSASAPQGAPLKLITPKIDQVLERFRHRALASTDGFNTSSTTEEDAYTGQMMNRRQAVAFRTTGAPAPFPRQMRSEPTQNHEGRIRELEQQLSDVLMKRAELEAKGVEDSNSTTATTLTAEKTFPRGHRHKRVAKRDTDHTDESDADGQLTRSSSKERRGKKLVSKATVTKGQKMQKNGKLSTRLPQPMKAAVSQKSTTSSPGSGQDADGRTMMRPARNITNSSAEQDAEKLILLQELDSERERRWKAEQAAIRLADHVKTFQSKASEERELQDVTLEATSRLKQALMNEKEHRVRLEEQLENAQAEVKNLTGRLETVVQSEEEKHQTLRAMETTARKLEAERMQQHAHEAKRLQEYQLKTGATGRELDLVRTQAKQSEVKIQQLQELLATREQEHRNEISQMYRLDSKEMQEMIDKQIMRERQSHEKEHSMYQQRIDELTRQYNDLEDEFRLALRLESDRYQQIQDAYENATMEATKYRESIEGALTKEKRASGLVTELTAMVKEQKARIAELSRSKQDIMLTSKDHAQTQERQLEEARRRLLQFEVLKKEKSKLEADLVAHESVVEGLKAERKLWGQELAQQGSSLAQDRGRLESRIEVLNAEVKSLKRQMEQDSDALKIKTKVIDDQTETIKKLKEAVFERDDEIKKAREENLEIQRSLEAQLAEEQSSSHELREQVDRLQERKGELKQQVQEVQLELDESQRAYRNLDQKWKDKGDLISTLEDQVRQVKKTFDEKEHKFKAERDKALEKEKIASDRMHAMDDAFRHQLETAQRAHEEHLEEIRSERQMELDQANQKVVEVEEEMRQLLAEAANQKKAMEEKARRITKAFSDLQADLG